MTTHIDSDGELYSESELESHFIEDTANLDDHDRAALTFEDWLDGMVSWGRFSVVDDDQQ